MIADVAGGILLAGLTLYAALGGADFGGGLWDLLAGGDQRGRGPRQLIDDTITPVWEANHVWLIFVLVIFWTAFPAAFAAVMTAAALPLWLAAFGIVLRGAGFAFRKEVQALGWQRLFGFGFAFSSLIVPFFMGTVIGAIASGRVPASLAHTDLAVWTGPTSLLTGALFVAVCGYLAAVFLTREASRRGQDRLRRYFARRAAVAGAVSGALALATLAEIHGSSPALFHGLTHRALPLVIVSAGCGVAVLAFLATGRSPGGLRPLSVLGVAAVVWGWGVAQYPVLLPGTGLTLTTGAAPHSILVTVVVVFVAAVVLVGPSFLLLFSLHGRQLLEPENMSMEPGTIRAPDPGSTAQ